MVDDVTNFVREKRMYYCGATLKKMQRIDLVPTYYKEYSRRTESDVTEEVCILGSDWLTT